MNTLRLENINRQHVTSHVDIKLRQTITAIIEEFFEVNGNEVMLYITETGDGKQMFRNRLFVRWFNMYNQHDSHFHSSRQTSRDMKRLQ